MIRLFQTNEGLTLLDDTDTFEALTYAFTGLDDLLLQFGQQLSGATRHPAGAPLRPVAGRPERTGESDIRNYYDGIKSQAGARLRPDVAAAAVVHQSVLGRPAPDGFNFKFVPLWQLTETEKADIADEGHDRGHRGLDAGIIDRPTALKELRSADVTGVFSNITDEEIEEADRPSRRLRRASSGPATATRPTRPGKEGDGPGRPRTTSPFLRLHGLAWSSRPRRARCAGPDGWSLHDGRHYGYIRAPGAPRAATRRWTASSAPNPASHARLVIDQVDPDTGRFDEHKCMLGYDEADAPCATTSPSYSDRGFDRIAA
jgi:hypothetical protein